MTIMTMTGETARTVKPEQRTMPIEAVLDLRSGDHGGIMRQFPDGPSRSGWYWGRSDYERVDVIAESMTKNGWDGPPICVTEGTVNNGHHRTIAAYMVGLTDIPVTDDWDGSASDFEQGEDIW